MFFFFNSDLETFIQEYIDQKNKEVSEYNAEVRRSADQYLDLFAWEGSARPSFWMYLPERIFQQFQGCPSLW